MKKVISSVTCSVAVILGLVFGQPNDLETSKEGLEHTANREGCMTQAYQCSAGTWTSGLGHTSNTKEGDTVTNEQIAENFISDISKAEKVVNRHLKVDVTQAQFDVLVSFVFNLGSGNFRSSTILKLFNKSEPALACNQFMRWVYVSGKNCNDKENNCYGIVKRRIIEKNACLNGW